MHPFVPVEQTRGLSADLRANSKPRCARSPDSRRCRCSRTPARRANSPGLMVIRAYHQARGDGAPRRRADSRVRARHQSRERRHGRHAGRRRRRTTANGNIDVADLRAKAASNADRLAALMVTYPSTHGVFEEAHPGHLRDRPRARRPGVHGRRQHERAGRPHQSGGDRRRRVPPEPAQDVRHSARRRRAGHGPDRRGGAPRAVPAGPPARRHAAASTRSRAVSAAPWGSASILLISYGYIRMLGRRRHDRRDALRHPQRQLHQGAAASALPGALHAGRTAASRTR